ncbi:two-component system sensor histidine kinase DesK [Nocardiopsis sp. Huas11]|uniref:sensor histidine kinase n=1 Tax=Nocardiopsis sp. Huas11 TaxID=2183912 RepID=UPI000F2696FB|nr:histidine kinase [Nocardiopsis sp. Huas11]RKS06230.1 two-component system sensor histidine kinase DesK [Nocardiopsis sp. Huas11]
MDQDEAVPGSAPATTVTAVPDARNDRKLRISRRIIIVSMSLLPLVMVFWPLQELVLVADHDGFSAWRSAVAVAVAVPLAGLLFQLIRNRIGLDGGTLEGPPWMYWASLALVLLCAVLLQNPFSMMLTLGTWWCVGVFIGSRRRAWLVTVGLLVMPWLLSPFIPDVDYVLYALVWAGSSLWSVSLAGGFLASIWLWDLTMDAVLGQRARAQLAVSEERLRFARDMHDLLGHSLSALAVKSELAGRLVERAPDRAIAEMAEVQDLARQALQQVRSAVSGYREVDLAAEVRSVREVLRANGTEVIVTGLEGLEVPADKAGLAAWVVREGGTNVLRHSDATECAIGFSVTKDVALGSETLVVEVFNDRIRHPGKADGLASGNGLSGLSERVAMGGGALSAARTGDNGFLLRAIIPLGRPGPVAADDRARRKGPAADD